MNDGLKKKMCSHALHDINSNSNSHFTQKTVKIPQKFHKFTAPENRTRIEKLKLIDEMMMITSNRDPESRWSWEEDKRFENSLVEFPDGCPNRWERIAARIGTKSAPEVERHYVVLLDDVMAIDGGFIEVPEYSDVRSSGTAKEKKQTAVKRKVARPWTEEEHRLFLLGLDKYGKGDWKSIARYMVLTRNPAQVASHAQKYFERQEKEAQNKKRRSIFDNSISESSSVTSNFTY